ncbi:MAG TPA: LysM peptidoglycan-binding domain-containing protein [Xanthomonadales bacterium]|nr:LysM peptidoglycan-binding domain-containing protein [Xanthomonadales bacterium]
MGFLDSLKNALGGKKEPEPDVTISPSQVLRDNGIDPSGLKMSFAADGNVTVSGTVASVEDRQRIPEILKGIDGINGVHDHMNVEAPVAEEPVVVEPVEVKPVKVEPVEIPSAEPDSQVGSVDAPGGASEVEGGAPAGAKTYTVQSGDTLWKISEEHYGNGSKYMKIFEANKDLLDDPDKIFPGQELTIPDLED